MDILNVIIAAISGGLLTQFVNAKINAKKGRAEIDDMKRDIEKKISMYYKEEIDYQSQRVEKYKKQVEELTSQVEALSKEVKQLQAKLILASANKTLKNKNNGGQRKTNK